MNNIYAAEKLMQQQIMRTEKLSREYWKLSEEKQPRPVKVVSLINKLHHNSNSCETVCCGAC